MPFDYNSFLKGVITGMKLPRVPGEVRPPPPVPSDVFILTESGAKIFEEKADTSDCTIFMSGVVYPTSEYAGLKVTTIQSGLQFFIADSIASYPLGPYSIVVFGPIEGDRIQGEIWFVANNGAMILEGSFDVQDPPIAGGNAYAQWDGSFDIPLNTDIWHGSRWELPAFIASLTPKPMITEGGSNDIG